VERDASPEALVGRKGVTTLAIERNDAPAIPRTGHEVFQHQLERTVVRLHGKRHRAAVGRREATRRPGNDVKFGLKRDGKTSRINVDDTNTRIFK
jgi:hypothetical protein